MRKNQIDSAAVNIHGCAEVAHCHRGALEVPAWAPATPRGIPRSTRCFILVLRRFPERKILSIFLGIVVLRHASAALDLSGIQSRQLSVAIEPVDRVIDGAI